MIDSQQFLPSDSDTSGIEVSQHEVCILKHIPAARALLCPQSTTYEIFSPRCLYANPLASTNRGVMPKLEVAQGQPKVNRLLSIEDACFEHYKIKEKIRDWNSKDENDEKMTLWETYGEREIYFNRFDAEPRKDYFASLFMNINGMVLEANKKNGNLPSIKGKGNQTPVINTGSAIFDAHFESGNLLYVFKNDNRTNSIDTFDLVLQNDVNTKGHNQWFYFKVHNTKKNQKVRFNIVNLVKKESLFSYGLKPLVYSDKLQSQGVGWHRGGIKVVYEKNNIRRDHKNEQYYTLSFEYEFREANDTVYFAPSYPYTYSQLLHYMDSLLERKVYQPCLSVKKLCETAGKNTVNIITIGTGKKHIRDCKVVWILGRQHPVQTTSSYMVEGAVSYLLELMVKAHGESNSYYDDFVFKIVPMINPDGVIHGNTRAEVTGIDTNRVWKKPHKSMTPTIYQLKKAILKTKEETTLVLDFHSHSKKLGCFFYGNYNSMEIASYRLLPSLVCQRDVRFHYKNCRFRGGNENSARRTLYHELGIPNIFTVQCSLLGFVKDNRINQFKISDYYEMSRNILETYFSMEPREARGTIKRVVESYPHQQEDFCDAQSARSDSCISEDEYREVYKFLKMKKKVKEPKKSKLKSNAYIKPHKYYTSEPQRQNYNSSAKIREQVRSETLVHARNESVDKNNLVVKKEPFRECSYDVKVEGVVKNRGKYNSRNIRFNTKKMVTKTIKNQTQIFQKEPFSDKTFNEMSVQVEDQKGSQMNSRSKEKRKLMVIGSGVEEDKVVVGRNQVGVQIDSSAKENARSSSQLVPAFKNGSASKMMSRGKEESEGGWDRLAKIDNRAVKLFRI